MMMDHVQMDHAQGRCAGYGQASHKPGCQRSGHVAMRPAKRAAAGVLWALGAAWAHGWPHGWGAPRSEEAAQRRCALKGCSSMQGAGMIAEDSRAVSVLFVP